MPSWSDLLDKSTPLTVEECLELLRSGSFGGADNPWPKKIVARLAIEQMLAVKKFDQASARLTERLVWLTWALVFLGIVQVAVVVLPLLHK
jgi:hypothetical protein